MCREDPVHLGNSNNSSNLEGMGCREGFLKREKEKPKDRKKQRGKGPANPQKKTAKERAREPQRKTAREMTRKSSKEMARERARKTSKENSQGEGPNTLKRKQPGRGPEKLPKKTAREKEADSFARKDVWRKGKTSRGDPVHLDSNSSSISRTLNEIGCHDG